MNKANSFIKNINITDLEVGIPHLTRGNNLVTELWKRNTYV